MSTATIFLDWTPRDWNAFGQVLLGLGVIVGGMWTVYIYGRAKRDDAARWLHSFFLTFYTDPEMIAARDAMTYFYSGDVASVLEFRVTDRDVVLTTDEREHLRLADLLLNYFEEIIYLEKGGHLTQADRNLFFEYWLNLLHEPGYASLRRYVAKCGYDQLASWADAGQDEYVAFSAHRNWQQNDRTNNLRYVQECMVHGVAAVGGGAFRPMTERTVKGYLYRLEPRATFRGLDDDMGYTPEARTTQAVRRRCVRLVKPSLDAWIYLGTPET